MVLDFRHLAEKIQLNFWDKAFGKIERIGGGMELYQIKSFVAIARERNLTRAARLRHLSQSALSSQLKALEAELGVSLFTRTARGMELTEAGEMLLVQAREVLEAAERMRQKAMALHRGGSESVTIGLNADPSFLRVGQINRRLSLLHPNLNVIFLTSQTVDTARMLLRGRIDLGFHYGQLAAEGVESQPIAHVRVCVVIPGALAGGGREMGWEEIAELPWVWVGDGSPFYARMMEGFERRRLMPNQAVSAADEQVVRELVLAGQGVALMREDEAVPLVESGEAAIWEPGWMSIPLCLAWLKEKRDKERIGVSSEAIRYVWRGTGGAGDLADKCWV